MYMIPKRTEAQKAYYNVFNYEKYRQEDRQRRMTMLSRVVIRKDKDTDEYRVVYYKDRYICCLFDNDKYANERIIRIIVNLLGAIE